MQQGDLDELITRFEQLVQHTNYDVNQPLILHIFIDALPHAMYEFIFKNIQPCTYKGWCNTAIQQQKMFIHMKSRLKKFRHIPNLPDPNAMDLSPGRACIAETEDFEPGKN
jgi:hypothetical protein